MNVTHSHDDSPGKSCPTAHVHCAVCYRVSRRASRLCGMHIRLILAPVSGRWAYVPDEVQYTRPSSAYPGLAAPLSTPCTSKTKPMQIQTEVLNHTFERHSQAIFMKRLPNTLTNLKMLQLRYQPSTLDGVAVAYDSLPGSSLRYYNTVRSGSPPSDSILRTLQCSCPPPRWQPAQCPPYRTVSGLCAA